MLQKLDISDNTFNVSGALELSKSLRSLPRMVVLNIGDLNFKDEGITHLLKTLVEPVCPNLETLDMSLNDLSCESLKYLPDALAGKRQFKHLRLKGNFDLGNKGCVIVAKTISMPSFSSKRSIYQSVMPMIEAQMFWQIQSDHTLEKSLNALKSWI